MAIMQTCCCWRSVRRGSFACAVYTVFYYAVIAVTLASVLQEESQYLTGNRSQPKSNSVLVEQVSPVTMTFNIALLVCSSLGVICCLLLLYGLFKDEKMFLVPWICIMIACCVVDISHLIYAFIGQGLKFNPVTAMILTIDFFLMCLNIYAVLCVYSQYQEYTVGRGTAAHDCPQRVPTVRYTVQPTATATSCLSSRRTTATTVEGRTPIQSPTTYLTIVHPPPSTNRLILPSNELKLPGRKHVKFPDAIDHDVIEKIDETFAIQICPAEESDDDEEDDEEDEEEDEEEMDYYHRQRRKNGTTKNGRV
ncbi:uncharacterized protein LOC131665342 [Phymastichus coffea]|uniref:uncharacterized protein LOC131665342 n=1 Tax=Phymastichus coffea TaxID=108790 RepID=UPI00273CCD21|nr:uncharacterized protein LOC131665342 [Phymastichus coffea]